VQPALLREQMTRSGKEEQIARRQVELRLVSVLKAKIPESRAVPGIYAWPAKRLPILEYKIGSVLPSMESVELLLSTCQINPLLSSSPPFRKRVPA
jgi:hypothetical protein